MIIHLDVESTCHIVKLVEFDKFFVCDWSANRFMIVIVNMAGNKNSISYTGKEV
jgi:hypothetical protein